MIKYCACGKPLHYTSKLARRIVEAVIADDGEFITITRVEDGRSWLVQRHYIALHGLLGGDLGTERVPVFEEITNNEDTISG